jgi:uncharacterized protein
MIVDCHVHLNNYHKERHIPTAEHLKSLQEQMDKHKLDHAIVLTSYLQNKDRPTAEQVLDLVRQDKRLHVVEGLGVLGEESVDWEGVGRRLRERQTIGLKLYPGYEHAYPSDPVFLPAIELAAKYRVPVMIHTGDTYAAHGKLKYAHPLHVDDVAVDYPDVEFIICHLGNPWFRDTAEIIYKNENVHADISGLVLEEFTAPMEKLMRKGLEELLMYSGDPDSILYGTDWPLVRMGPYLRFVENLKLGAEHKAKLMGGNAMRVFRLTSQSD